jgi:phosphoribosylformylglycinamidine synthase
MTPYEILLSESQERMLVVAEPGRVAEVQAICSKWELGATPIGFVTSDGMFRVRHGDLVVAEIPGQRLVDDCPIYHPESRESDEVKRKRASRPTPGTIPNFNQALDTLLDTPSIASKKWVFEQYDSTVQGSSAILPGGDAGVLRVADTDFGLAVTVDCNARLLALNPYEGGKAAVAEAARNVAVTGAAPLGITDCLNFGSPEKPEVFYQFIEACRGISDACVAFGIPVTGGNVSFYNESPTGAIDPTPAIGLVGLLERIGDKVESHFRASGDRIVVLGLTEPDALGGSAYWGDVLGFVVGEPPMVNLENEKRLQTLLVAGAKAHVFESAHDCSTGGLAVALAEAAMGGPYAEGGFGLNVDFANYARREVSDEALLFGETGARAVVTVKPENLMAVIELGKTHRVPVFDAGAVAAEGGVVTIRRHQPLIERPVAELRNIYFEAIPRRMAQPVTVSE